VDGEKKEASGPVKIQGKVNGVIGASRTMREVFVPVPPSSEGKGVRKKSLQRHKRREGEKATEKDKRPY